MRRVVAFFFILLLISFKAYSLDGVEVLSGFFRGNLEKQGDYKAAQLLVDFDYSLKPFFADHGLNVPGRLDFSLEPFISGVYDPKGNFECGNSFMLKWGVPITKYFMPFIRMGLGFTYMTQHVVEQGSQWNFLPQGGMGAHFFIRDGVALTLEGRFRHLSNNNFSKPNGGIEVIQYLGGFSYFFGAGEPRK